MAEPARAVSRDVLVELHQSAHGLENDLAAIRMCTEFSMRTASKNHDDPLLASIRRDLDQVYRATEEAFDKVRSLVLRLQEVLDNEEMPV